MAEQRDEASHVEELLHSAGIILSEKDRERMREHGRRAFLITPYGDIKEAEGEEDIERLHAEWVEPGLPPEDPILCKKPRVNQMGKDTGDLGRDISKRPIRFGQMEKEGIGLSSEDYRYTDSIMDDVSCRWASSRPGNNEWTRHRYPLPDDYEPVD